MDNITTFQAALQFMKQSMDSENGCVFMFIADGDHALKVMKMPNDGYTVHLNNVAIDSNPELQFEMAFRMSAFDMLDMAILSFFESRKCPTTSTTEQHS